MVPEDGLVGLEKIPSRLLVPLREALEEMGVPDPETSTELLNAVVHTASRRVEQTGELERAYDAAAAMLDAYLRTADTPTPS